MLKKIKGNAQDHEKYLELAALSNTGSLSAAEVFELREHLKVCKECSEIRREYSVIDRQAMPIIAEALGLGNEVLPAWDHRAARAELMARVRVIENNEEQKTVQASGVRQALRSIFALRPYPAIRFAVLASLILAVAVGIYKFENQRIRKLEQNTVAQDARIHLLTAHDSELGQSLNSKTSQVAELELAASEKEKTIAGLESTMKAKDAQISDLLTSRSFVQGQLDTATNERSSLAKQLQSTEATLESVRAELVKVRSDHNQSTLQLASLELENSELRTLNRDYEGRLKDAEQFLSSDRDVRELMGARNLYISDVYDVDSTSRTRKPFGRLFYTEGKSLIFYAFDLDHSPGVKNASLDAFQVWGRKHSDVGGAVNLGILYMDNVSKKRWALRVDNPKQLEELNAIFVTVEPKGGSEKPTSKPFLYALLRKEANHP